MRAWSKTILSVYKYLEALSKAIDDLVLKKSINSAFYCNGRFDTAYECANKIMQLTNRKINLINLKVLVEDTLESIPLKYRRVLGLCYIDGVKTTECAELLHISNRTFFRLKNDAINVFTQKLIGLGYTKSKLEEIFCGENWLKNLYNHNSDNAQKDFDADLRKYRFFKNVIREFNMVY